MFGNPFIFHLKIKICFTATCAFHLYSITASKLLSQISRYYFNQGMQQLFPHLLRPEAVEFNIYTKACKINITDRNSCIFSEEFIR